MREYSATSVSKANASSLADKLTEQSRDGWELVEIVRTDDQIVAYLSREGSGSASGQHSPAGSPSASSHGAATQSATSHGAAAQGAVPQGGNSYGTTSGSTQGGATGERFTSGSTIPAGGYVASETTAAVTDEAGNTFVEDDMIVAPVSNDGGNGWAAGSAAGAATSFANQTANTANQASDSAHKAAHDAGHQATSAAGSAGSSAPASGGGQSSQQSHTSSADSGSGSDLAPAGWYADPAGRFDLRYWDGAQWTEHVARNGHQETDPPIR